MGFVRRDDIYKISYIVFICIFSLHLHQLSTLIDTHKQKPVKNPKIVIMSAGPNSRWDS
jgi:hypothetical protein